MWKRRASGAHGHDAHTAIKQTAGLPLPASQPASWQGAHLNLANSAGHNGLQHRATVVVQQMDLINDDQPHQLGVGAVT